MTPFVLLCCVVFSCGNDWPAMPTSATSYDFPPLADSSDARFPAIVYQPIEALDVKPQATGACLVGDEGSCPNGSCRAPARGRLDELQPSEFVPGPARRFQPFRNLFRGRR